MAATPPQHPAPDQPHACSFDPGNEELLSVYLPCRLAGAPLPAGTSRFLHDADVYAADPATLVAGFLGAPSRIRGRKNWFFFTPVRPTGGCDGRKYRTAGDGRGTWKAEKGKEDVADEVGRQLGYLQKFTFRPKDGSKTEWLMVEYSVDQDDGGAGRRPGEPVLVLCKIYQSPRFLASVSKPSSSASSRKRKAPDERHGQASSSPVRRRLFLWSPPRPTTTPPDEPRPQPEELQGETSPLDRGFSMADHACSALSCYGTTLPRPGADWGIPPCAPDAQNSGSWTSGMGFLADLPTGEDFWSSIAGSGQDAPYCCSEPSLPARRRRHRLCCAAEWAPAMQLPLRE